MQTKFAVIVATVWVLAFFDTLIRMDPVPFSVATPALLIVLAALFSSRNGKAGNGRS